MARKNMPKKKTFFICQNCGYESRGWLGKCPGCNEWNTFTEEMQQTADKKSQAALLSDIKLININDVKVEKEDRYKTGMKEMDRVLGGGIVKGSLILVGGDPSIGKSTLLLQICDKIKEDPKIIYISGEESIKQIKIRADRLGVSNSNLLMVSETNFKIVHSLCEKEKPNLIIVDSIQTMFNEELSTAPGSISQVRDITAGLMRIAKSMNIAVIIV